MGILEELAPRANMIAAIEDYLDSLDKKERAEWETVFDNKEKYLPSAIVAALKRRGVTVNVNAIHRYRSKKDASNG